MQVPIHQVLSSEVINVEDLKHKNPYDHQVLHKHFHFELIFFQNAEGNQRIDFHLEKIHRRSISLVLPHSLHLLECSNNSIGKVIQFTNKAVDNKLLAQLRLSRHRSKNYPTKECRGEDWQIIYTQA
ncbi:MAG: hypothetical protein AAF193_06795, partial [Bacteroidota bacterium]